MRPTDSKSCSIKCIPSEGNNLSIRHKVYKELKSFCYVSHNSRIKVEVSYVMDLWRIIEYAITHYDVSGMNAFTTNFNG